MNNQYHQYSNKTEFITPSVSLVVTTYELVEEPKGHYFWNATVTHVFHGETEERVYQISEAHKHTDAFYRGSFEGKYKDIILKNSGPQIM